MCPLQDLPCHQLQAGCAPAREQSKVWLVDSSRMFGHICSCVAICYTCCNLWECLSVHTSLIQGGPVLVRLRFVDGTVRAVPVFGSGGSSKEGVFVCFSTVSQRGRVRFRFWFLENGSGSVFGSCKNGSDGSGLRFRFGSWATLLILSVTQLSRTHFQIFFENYLSTKARHVTHTHTQYYT